MSRKRDRVMRFRVRLEMIEPAIWRTIDVPESYSFWDLHVAIQDAMGWLDYHLHVFTCPSPPGEVGRRIGIPDENFDDDALPGWEVPVSEWCGKAGDVLRYEYDFGDGWEHRVELVEVLPREPGREYPRCVEGERACPPEDCGGPPGYGELLMVLRDPTHEEHADRVRWLQEHDKNYHQYDPEDFDPEAVRFDDPKRRFEVAFGDGGMGGW